MIARCARCQNTFTTDHFGVQKCPHCDSELMLADPNASAAPSPSEPSSPAPAPPDSAAPPAPGFPPPPQPGVPFAEHTGPTSSEPAEIAAPFAERDQLGWVSAFGKTWKLATLEPHRFFQRVRIDQSQSAVLFGVVSITLAQWALATLTYLLGPAVLESLSRMPYGRGVDAGSMQFFFSFVALAGRFLVAPILALVSIYVLAGLFHLILAIFGGSKRGFGATLTVVGYCSGVQLLAAIPACGATIAGIWFLVVTSIGLGEAQRCGAGKGAAAVLPIVLTCLCCVAALAMLIGMF